MTKALQERSVDNDLLGDFEGLVADLRSTYDSEMERLGLESSS